MRVITRQLLSRLPDYFHIHYCPVLLCITGTDPWKICFLGFCLWQRVLWLLPLPSSQLANSRIQNIVPRDEWQQLPCRRLDILSSLRWRICSHWNIYLFDMHLLVLILEACSASPITTTTGFTECLRSDQSPTCFCPCESLVFITDLRSRSMCLTEVWNRSLKLMLQFGLGDNFLKSWVLSYIENMNFNLLTKMHISRNWGVEVEVAISCVT